MGSRPLMESNRIESIQLFVKFMHVNISEFWRHQQHNDDNNNNNNSTLLVLHMQYAFVTHRMKCTTE